MSDRVRQALSNALSRYYEPESEGDKEAKMSAKNKTRRGSEANKAENDTYWQRMRREEKERK